MAEQAYDLIVVGGGPGGYEAALHAAKLGLRTALVEKRELGGTCLNRGCVPTKALLHGAEVYRAAQEAERWGVRTGEVAVDFAVMQAKKREIVSGLREGIGAKLRAAKVDVLTGTGCLLEAGAVRVADGESTTVLRGKAVLLATGAVPAALPLPGADLPGVWNSDALLEAERLPASLLIVGGGVIGVEFASAFAALGTRVTVIEARDRLLPEMDREIGQSLALLLKKRGVTVHLSASVAEFTECDAAGMPGVRCAFTERGAQEHSFLDAEAALVCVGRKPFSDGLLAEGCGLAAERGAIRVDAKGRTALPGVWAIGDVTGGIQLAHYATAQGIAAAEDIAGRTAEMKLDVVPGCVYTDPEIACVGLTADAAKAEGREVRTGKCVLGGNARTQIAGTDRSFIKLVADKESGVLLGAQLMCARASDMIGEFVTAIAQGLTLAQLQEGMRAHPTFYEAAGEAIEAAMR